MRKIAFSLVLAAISLGSIMAEAVKVSFEKTDEGFQMLRDGKPYYVRGAGGDGDMDIIVECGGNSIRTWGHEGIGKTLDEAHARGLTVTIGLWMGHERHGFDYTDKWAVKGQLETFRKVVEEHKDHPALLMWGIGNEVDLFYENFDVWYAVNDVAEMIHELDPNHPTMTVTAGIDVAEIQLIQMRAPAIDVIGINAYGGVYSVPKSIELYGWEKPYLVTEWGPTGHWETAKTEWDAAIDVTSTKKAEVYRERYEDVIAKDPQCVGSYVFLWGNKQETTDTWFSMFLSSGERLQTVETMQMCWSGKAPANATPRMSTFTLNERTGWDNIYLKSGKTYDAQTTCTDPDGDEISYQWKIVQEVKNKSVGGDVEAGPSEIDIAFRSDPKKSSILFEAPKEKGPYRLFVYAFDGKGNVATANWPFYVK